MPSLEFRRARGGMIECCKLSHELYDPLTTSGLLELDTNKSTRAEPFKLKKKRFNTTQYQNIFTNHVINRCNSLPHSIVNADSLNVLKKRLDNHWGEHKFSNEGS